MYKRRLKQIIYDYDEKLSNEKAENRVALRLQENNYLRQESLHMKNITEAVKAQNETKSSFLKKFHELKLVCFYFFIYKKFKKNIF